MKLFSSRALFDDRAQGKPGRGPTLSTSRKARKEKEPLRAVQAKRGHTPAFPANWCPWPEPSAHVAPRGGTGSVRAQEDIR